MNSDSVAPLKKPYEKPDLRVYGDISAMTGTGGALAASDDNGKGAQTKTA